MPVLPGAAVRAGRGPRQTFSSCPQGPVRIPYAERIAFPRSTLCYIFMRIWLIFVVLCLTWGSCSCARDLVGGPPDSCMPGQTGRTLRLDVYQARSAYHSPPAIVAIHGGAGRMSRRSSGGTCGSLRRGYGCLRWITGNCRATVFRLRVPRRQERGALDASACDEYGVDPRPDIRVWSVGGGHLRRFWPRSVPEDGLRGARTRTRPAR